MNSPPRDPAGPGLVIVTGGDELVESVACDLREAGYRVTVVWHASPPFRARLEECGATFVERSPRRRDALAAVGVEDAAAVLALDHDDRINLDVALAAREANPGVRIVMRQFNRTLARKIERNLANCTVLSLASHSAATYAAAAVEKSTFYGVEFPTGSRSLVAFVRREAGDTGVAGLTPAEIERKLECRVLQRAADPPGEGPVAASEELVLFGPLASFARIAPALRTSRSGLGWIANRVRAIAAEFDPLLRVLFLATVCVFLAASAYFALILRLNPITAAYFVVTTMTTVGYGDISLADKGIVPQIAGIALMTSGVVIGNLAVAFVAAALVRAQWNALQGLRSIHDTGHIIVFGAGRVGTRVVDYLCELGAAVTVVELHPAPELVRRARSHEINLLTGDATLDDTIDLCNLGAARSTVVVTDSDSTNLEVGFGARARRGDIPVIMRVNEPEFAAAIRRHFEIRRAFAATALAASVFGDLITHPSARGRVTVGGRAYRVEEYGDAAAADRSGMVVAAATPNGAVRSVHGWDDVAAGDAVLLLRPLDDA
jgi:Trk K+ transport system NAD-binding subunit